MSKLGFFAREDVENALLHNLSYSYDTDNITINSVGLIEMVRDIDIK